MPFYLLAAELNSVSKVKVWGPFHKTILWLRSILWLRYHHIRFTKLSWIMIILRSLIILRQPNTCLKSNFMMTGAYDLVHHRRSSIIRVRATLYTLLFSCCCWCRRLKRCVSIVHQNKVMFISYTFF